MTSYVKFLLLCGLYCLLTPVVTEKILLVPMLHGSHVIENLRLGQALNSKRHEVYLALPKVSKHNALVSGSGVKPLTFDTAGDFALLESEYIADFTYNVTFHGYDNFELLGAVTSINDRYCDAIMHQETFLNSIRDHRFDVVITPGPIIISCMLILP